jgi:hypothetical protein
MQKMRWSRVIGCGLLAATHHTGRVKFRIANANVNSPKWSARGAEQRFRVEAPAFRAGVSEIRFRFCALALVVADQDSHGAWRMRKGTPPDTAPAPLERGYQKYNRDALHNPLHRGCDGCSAGLPDASQSQFTPPRSRIPALDVLHSFLQRDLFRRCDDQMKMIGHDNELVKFESPLGAINVKRFNEELGGVSVFEKCVPTVRDGCDEERADFLRSMGHV